MSNLAASCSLLVACLIYVGLTQADEPEATGGQPPHLNTVFSDDFSKDNRGDYSISGDVKWEEGKLSLMDGASIKREIHGGAWARVDLQFAPSELRAADTVELRVWFIFGEGTCFVRIQNVRSDTIKQTVALVTRGLNLY